MGRQISSLLIRYVVDFVYSALLKFTVMMMLLPIFLIITTFFDARFPDWFVWLFIRLNGSNPTFSIDEFVKVILLIVFVFWLIEKIILYILAKYFHKKISVTYGYQLKTWFLAVSVVYLIGLLSIFFANIAEGSSVGMMYLVVIIFYIIAIIPLGICRFLERIQQATR
ncbi:hypothetical protein KJ836_01465 [Patescibacteria group bacterium]|nr:hypothetical protein [Patescibacteria group bacterium]